jgi:uncharacterized protein (TIGR00297 family)
MPDPESHHNENLRQLEHLIPVGFAFLLPYLSWAQAVLCGFLAMIYGVFVSSRLWRGTRRPNEALLGFSPGKAAYAVGILGLLTVFRGETYIVAAVWANLSVGDAASNLIGRNFGRRALPWNPRKTWLGSLGAFVCAAPAAYILMIWNGARDYATWVLAVAVTLVCTLVETIPLPLDDNLTICIAGGLTMALLTRAAWPSGPHWVDLAIGFGISVTAAMVAWLVKTVSFSGAFWGVLFGSIVYFALGIRGFALLGGFFVLGSLFSKVGYQRKAAVGIAQPNLGRRAGKHVWGKGIAAVLAAAAALFLPDRAPALLAYVAALAASLADTTATELGQLLGRRTISLSSFEEVPAGTPGAISFAGSLCGLFAAILTSVAGYGLQFVSAWGGLWVVAAAVFSIHLEGFMTGRHREERPGGPLMNAFHTTIAMLVALLLARIRS